MSGLKTDWSTSSYDCPRCGQDPEDCWCEGPEGAQEENNA